MYVTYEAHHRETNVSQNNTCNAPDLFYPIHGPFPMLPFQWPAKLV